MNSGEALCKAISDTTHMEFGLIKVIFDVSVVAASLILSFLLLGRNVSVREGTVITALSVGSIARLILPRLEPLRRWMKDPCG